MARGWFKHNGHGPKKPRICRVCSIPLVEENWYPSMRSGNLICKECFKANGRMRRDGAVYPKPSPMTKEQREARKKEHNRKWYEHNKEKARLSKLEWRQNNREEHRARAKAARWRLKVEAITGLGGFCACCGEKEMRFLTVDHIHGGGGKHRVEVGNNDKMYRLLKRLGYPLTRFRVLCFNCNMAIGFFGACPHQDVKQQKDDTDAV